MPNCCVVAIDGYAACGKTTLARMLAKELGFLFIDSGAMYRAIALSLNRKKIKADSNQEISAHLQDISIRYIQNNQAEQVILLNGEDVTQAIRNTQINEVVSLYAKNALIRSYATIQQQQFQYDSSLKGLVMEGRDIGTTVFPEAQAKFFITCDIAVRAQRRYQEIKSYGKENPSLQTIQENLLLRDEMDRTRAISPLKKPEDTYELNSTSLSIEKLISEALQLIHKKCH